MPIQLDSSRLLRLEHDQEITSVSDVSDRAYGKHPILNNSRGIKINITDYPSLLLAANKQAEPQRLLFVFLKASLPEDHEREEASRFHSGQGGQLQPVMCVDKTLDELGTFADLVTEAEQMGQAWQIVLVACLPGYNGIMPSSDDATQPLKIMQTTVENGGDLSNYMAFDRDGIPVQFDS